MRENAEETDLSRTEFGTLKIQASNLKALPV
jgi:hypothetical protein